MNELDDELFDFLYDEDTDDFALFSFNEENADQYLAANPENESNLDARDAVSTSYDLTKSNRTRKRVYKPRSRVYIPKLVKNDIRNLYSTMFANVLNCQDYALWAGYFNTYFHKNLVLHQEFSMSHPKAPKSLEIQGSALCCDFLFSPLQACPDIAVRVSDIKIRMPSANTSRDSDSIIIANFVLEGTQIRDVPMDTFVIKDGDTAKTDNKSESITQQSSHSLTVCGTTNNCNSISSSSVDSDGKFIVNFISQEGKQEKMLSFAVPKYQEILDNSPLLSTPVPIIMAGSFTMHVDKNKVLTRLEFNYQNMDSDYMQEQMSKAFGAMNTGTSSSETTNSTTINNTSNTASTA